MNNFGDLNYILAISLQFSAVFLCFLTVFLHFGHFLGDSSQLFAYFSRFKDQFNWTNNHMQIRIIFQEYIKCHFRHFYLFIYLYTYVSPHFACSSWGDHYNDQGDQNWSWYRPRLISFSNTYCIRFGWTSGWYWTGGSTWSIFKVYQCDFWSFFVILGQFFQLL